MQRRRVSVTQHLVRSHSGHSGKSSMKGHKYDEGSGASHIWGKADQAGTVLPGKEKAQGNLTDGYKRYTVQRTETACMQWWLVTEQQAVGIQWTQEALSENQETLFPAWGWLSTGTSCPEKMGASLLRHIQKLSGCGPGQPFPRSAAWVGRVGPDGLQRSLAASNILWFFGIFHLFLELFLQTQSFPELCRYWNSLKGGCFEQEEKHLWMLHLFITDTALP